MVHEMTPDEREEYEQNRKELIDAAYFNHGISLGIGRNDRIFIGSADLGEMVEFYQNYRSEIEEML